MFSCVIAANLVKPSEQILTSFDMKKAFLSILILSFLAPELMSQEGEAEYWRRQYREDLEGIEQTTVQIERMIPNYDPEELRTSLMRFFELYGEGSEAERGQEDLAMQYDFLQQKMSTWVESQRSIQEDLNFLAGLYRESLEKGKRNLQSHRNLHGNYRRLLKEERKNREEFRRIQLSLVRMLQRRITWEEDQFFLNSVFDYLNNDVKPRVRQMEVEKDSLETSRQRLQAEKQGLSEEILASNRSLQELKQHFAAEREEYRLDLQEQKEGFALESAQILEEIAWERAQADREIAAMQASIADRMIRSRDTIRQVQRVSDSLQRVAHELDEAVKARVDSLRQLKMSLASLQDMIVTKDREVSEIRTEATSLRDYLYYGTLLILAGIVIATRITNAYLRRKKEELQIVNRRLNGQHSKLEILLKELHHRVKNNLQMVASMLNLQARQMGVEESRRALREARGRVQAMGLIHDKLYQSDNVTKVNLSEYIRELVQGLQDSYGMDKDSFRSSLEVQNITMETDRATPIGLIINELVTNCFKHAYKGHPNPELFINFYRTNANRLNLIIRDNGKGIEQESQEANGSSFGLKMVHLLVQELEADLKIQNNKGLSYHIEFDMNRKAA